MQDEMMNILPIPVMEFEPVRDEQGHIVDLSFVWANTAATQTLSPSGETLEGKNFVANYPHVRGGGQFALFVKTIEENEGQQVTVTGDPTSPFAGRVLQLTTSVTKKGCLVLIQDVTDVSYERDDARRRFEIMEAACNDAVNGIAIADKDYRMVYANPALCNMLGYTNEEILQLRVGDMMHEAESEVRQEQADKLLTEEIDQYVTDRTYLTKSGEEILMSISVSTLHAANGEDLSLAHFRDVREERKAQHALRSALVKAEEATRMKSEFLANMSHEIRTPLNGVIGMAQVLACSELSANQAEHVAIIRDSGANLMSLLNDILDLSKVEAGKVDVNPIEVDLRHKLNRVFKLHQPIAQEKGIGLDFVIHPSLPSRLKVDPVRLHQCVANLVSNAVKFTSKGKVVVAITSQLTKADQHKVTIHVSDTGIGISPDKLDHIFESFQQADGSTTRNFGGTGLGLTITRKLAQLMGGDLTVVSEEGRGSVFTLTILAGAEREMGVHQERLLANGPSDGFSDLKVLIVDDNVINRKVAASFLKAYGFETEEAVDGVDALNMLEKNAYDLILMDVHMPEMDGITAARKLRGQGSLNAAVPIIALTADAMSGDRERYLAKGMDGYVSKPINERELISEIGHVMTRAFEEKQDHSALG